MKNINIHIKPKKFRISSKTFASGRLKTKIYLELEIIFRDDRPIWNITRQTSL